MCYIPPSLFPWVCLCDMGNPEVALGGCPSVLDSLQINDICISIIAPDLYSGCATLRTNWPFDGHTAKLPKEEE